MTGTIHYSIQLKKTIIIPQAAILYFLLSWWKSTDVYFYKDQNTTFGYDVNMTHLNVIRLKV